MSDEPRTDNPRVDAFGYARCFKDNGEHLAFSLNDAGLCYWCVDGVERGALLNGRFKTEKAREKGAE